MLKYMLTTLVTAGITVATTLIAVDFQQERLIYSIGAPVQLGDLTHQKLRITNKGWSPATNVKIYLDNSRSGSEPQATVEADPPFDLPTPAVATLGGYERLRKNETAVVELTFKGPPLTAAHLSIKSDETIAVQEGSLEAETLATTLLKAVLPKSDTPAGDAVKVNCAAQNP